MKNIRIIFLLLYSLSGFSQVPVSKGGSNDASTSSNWTVSGADIYNNNSGVVNVVADFQKGTNAKGVKLKTISNYTGIWFDQITPDFTNYNFLYDFGIGRTVLNGPTGVALRANNAYNQAVRLDNAGKLWVNSSEGEVENPYLNELLNVKGGVHLRLQAPFQLGLSIQSSVGHTEDLIRVVNSSNATIFKVDVNGQTRATQYNVSAMNTAPATATSPCVTGEIRFTTTGIFNCIATNTWIKYTGSTF